MRLYNLILFAAAFGCSACSVNMDVNNVIEPSDHMVAHSVSSASFADIKASGDIKVIFTQCDLSYVRVTAPDNVMPYVKVKVEDNELIARIDNISTSGGTCVTVEAGAPTLSSVDISGVCSIDIDKLTTKNLDVEISGASKFTSGFITATSVDVEASGASNAQLSYIKANAVDLGASGASRVEARVDSALTVKADVSGASGVTLSGTCADATLEASGASTVNAKDLNAQRINSNTSGASTVNK